LIYALESAAEPDRARLREMLAKDDATTADIDEARAILERSGAREYTRERARTERDEALRRLESAGVVGVDALERLRLIVVSAISA
jgi:geranylgeranyl pyrophosphate synthase